MRKHMLSGRPEIGPLVVKKRGRDLTEELARRRYSLREFAAYVGIKSSSHARQIVLGVTQPNEELQKRIDEFLDAVCPLCGCKCPPRKDAKHAGRK